MHLAQKKPPPFRPSALLTSQTGGLFYAEHMQLKLRSKAALRGPTQLPDSYLMWLQTDYRILDIYINPTNWVKNKQMDLLTHT